MDMADMIEAGDDMSDASQHCVECERLADERDAYRSDAGMREAERDVARDRYIEAEAERDAMRGVVEAALVVVEAHISVYHSDEPACSEWDRHLDALDKSADTYRALLESKGNDD